MSLRACADWHSIWSDASRSEARPCQYFNYIVIMKQGRELAPGVHSALRSKCSHAWRSWPSPPGRALRIAMLPKGDAAANADLRSSGDRFDSTSVAQSDRRNRTQFCEIDLLRKSSEENSPPKRRRG